MKGASPRRDKLISVVVVVGNWTADRRLRMERELVWKQVYRAVRTISHSFPENHPGQGHPDVYPTWVIAVCWLWSCLWREPLAWSMRTLASRKKRRRYGQLGFPLPENIPDPSTVCRRMKRLDFQATLEAAN